MAFFNFLTIFFAMVFGTGIIMKWLEVRARVRQPGEGKSAATGKGDAKESPLAAPHHGRT